MEVCSVRSRLSCLHHTVTHLRMVSPSPPYSSNLLSLPQSSPTLLTSFSEPNGGYAIPPIDDNPWLQWADIPPLRPIPGDIRERRGGRDEGARAAPRQTALNLGAAIADRMGANVQYQHDRNTGNTRMRGEGAGSVLPVIATAVLMAFMRD